MLVQFGELKNGKITDITKYIGFKNYVNIFTKDAYFLNSIKNTMIFMVASGVFNSWETLAVNSWRIRSASRCALPRSSDAIFLESRSYMK